MEDMQVSFGGIKTRPAQRAVYGQRESAFGTDKSFLDQCMAAAGGGKAISQSQSEKLKAWIEKHKDKDFGAVMGGGVSTDKPLNWDADGSSELTREQIDYLKSTYDLSDMSKQEYYNLMADLTNMNAISIEDVVSQFVKPVVPGVVMMSVSQGDTERGMGDFNKYGNLYENLLQYMKDLNYMSERLAYSHSSMDSAAFFAFKDYLSDEKAMAGRFKSIFDLLA